MPESEGIIQDPQLLRYESFVNDRLRPDLLNVLQQRDKIYEEQAKWLKLRNQIDVLKEMNSKPLSTMMNVGCDFFMNAKIPDTSKMIVNVGADVYVEMTLDEATAFAQKKEKYFEGRSQQLTDKASQIRAHIKLVMQTIQDILAINKGDIPSFRQV